MEAEFVAEIIFGIILIIIIYVCLFVWIIKAKEKQEQQENDIKMKKRKMKKYIIVYEMHKSEGSKTLIGNLELEVEAENETEAYCKWKNAVELTKTYMHSSVDYNILAIRCLED